ncbi:hypothetical protein KSP39_PZI022577 [Platanthera zijinensis]|uniref:DDE Tnp4 domain-containing protein n=1 Tax=Platanthera zijinensis TaxID=2320716 RepID=A0AAP0AVW0_9ASPA
MSNIARYLQLMQINMSSSDQTDSSNEGTQRQVADRICRNRAVSAHEYLASMTAICEAGSSSNVACMTSSQTGSRWLGELLDGHPHRFFSSFRMSKLIFVDLLTLLTQQYGLQGSRRTLPREVLAVTLHILGHNVPMQIAGERFQHSTETISRFFSKGLAAIKRLSADVIMPVDHLFRDIPPQILNDSRYMPFFKDCIGAIDGTHVDARVPADQQVSYIGRHGTTTQNVMAVCDFNMCFTFVLAGWEGSTHDSRIFHRALMDPSYNFPYPPPGKTFIS